MAESGTDGSSPRSSRSLVMDDKFVYSSSTYVRTSLSSGMSDDDSFPSLSCGIEVPLPYRFEHEPSPEPSTEDSHARIVTDEEDVPHSRIGNTIW